VSLTRRPLLRVGRFPFLLGSATSRAPLVINLWLHQHLSGD
jgi:hypothetical protein